MKIVSWNACKKFRKKFDLVRQLGADVFVIQECENPALCKGRTIRERSQVEEYRAFAANGIWWGINKDQGIGIFAAPHIKLVDNGWDSAGYRCFGCARVNDRFDLIAVWTNSSRGSNPSNYASEFCGYFDLHAHRIGTNTLVMGDFNASPKWDSKRHTRAFTDIAERLHAAGLVSAYHHCCGETPGDESLYTRQKKNSGTEHYHIDYAFLAPEYIRSCHVELDTAYQPDASDHRPLVLEMEL